MPLHIGMKLKYEEGAEHSADGVGVERLTREQISGHQSIRRRADMERGEKDGDGEQKVAEEGTRLREDRLMVRDRWINPVPAH